MSARFAFAVVLSFGSLAACGAVTTRTADAAQPQIANPPAATAATHRCPASRPGRRQPALGIRCY